MKPLKILIAMFLAPLAGCAPEPSPDTTRFKPFDPNAPTETKTSEAKAKPVASRRYKDAVREAAQTGKPLLLAFHADWCGPSRQMNATLQDSRVKEKLKGFVVWDVDIDDSPELASRYSVQYIPSFRLVSANEQPYKSAEGYMNADQFVAWLTSSGEVIKDWVHR